MSSRYITSLDVSSIRDALLIAKEKGINTTVQAVISVKLLKFIDSLAKKENVSRSAMIKKLLIEEYENRRRERVMD